MFLHVTRYRRQLSLRHPPQDLRPHHTLEWSQQAGHVAEGSDHCWIVMRCPAQPSEVGVDEANLRDPFPSPLEKRRTPPSRSSRSSWKAGPW